MTHDLAMIALARTPHPDVVSAVHEMIQQVGGTLEHHNRVRVTPAASAGTDSDEVSGYSAATARISGIGLQELRAGIDTEGIWREHEVEFSFIPQELLDPEQRKLLVLDVDSTLIQDEVVEMLAARAGAADQVAAITERAMHGELDFAASLTERVALLEGLPESALHEVSREIRPAIGAKVLIETFRRAGHTVGAVSGGFRQVLAPLAERLELDHQLSNELEIVDGRLTGRVVGPVVDAAVKAQMLREWAQADGVSPEQTIAVGDGANDVEMVRLAAVGIAFNAKPVLREVADARISIPNLDSVRFFADL